MHHHHNMFMQQKTIHRHNIINAVKSTTTTTTNKAPPAANRHHHHHGPTTTQACAACKYQRRKCASDCILAPYFPHDKQQQFLNAHRLFGVSNIVKIVKNLDPCSKDQAMRTIMFQSDARAHDPVGGCYRIIRDLEHQIGLASAELEFVLYHLEMFRASAAAAQSHHRLDGVVPSPEVAADGGAGAVDGSWVDCMHDDGQLLQHAESMSSSFFPRETGLSAAEGDNDDFRPILDQLGRDDDGDDCNDLRGDEMIKFDCDGNVVTSNNNGGVTSPPEESKVTFKEEDDDDDCFHYVEDNYLKAAATFFGLTNCDDM